MPKLIYCNVPKAENLASMMSSDQQLASNLSPMIFFHEKSQLSKDVTLDV